MAKHKENPDQTAVPEGAFDRALARWKTPRYLRYQRGWLWFTLMLMSCVGLAVYGYWTGSWTMVAVFAILPFVLLLEHRKKPEMVDVVISEYGIRFGSLCIPYSNIRSFWILHTPPMVDELHLLTTSRTHPEVTIQLMGMDPVSLRQFLVTQTLEWEGKSLSFLEAITRILRLN